MRAFFTVLVLGFETLILGIWVQTVGLILPRRWCFDPTFRLWSRLLLAAAGVRLTIVGRHRLDRSAAYFFVGNHQSAFDIPLMAFVAGGRLRFMAKADLFRIPWFGWILRRHGFIALDRSSPRRAKQSIDRMLEQLAERPVSMVIFPEGTRTEDGQVGSFKRGAVQVCRRAGLPIVPFAIEGSLPIHRRGTWRIQPGPVRITLGEPIEPETIGSLSAEELATRLETQVRSMVTSWNGIESEEATSPPVQTSVAASATGRSGGSP